MNCCICGQKDIGTVYHLHFGSVCPACEGETREYVHKIETVPVVPNHIPHEQHKRYIETIINRRLCN